MRKFNCQCGQSLFFDSGQCVHCGAAVRFDPAKLDMVQVTTSADQLMASNGEVFYACQNQIEHNNCNWLRPGAAGPGLCFACCFNRTIPNLSVAHNKDRWDKLESGKRRLLYTLLALNLQIRPGTDDPNGLVFDFVEDGRTNPDFADQLHNTGYAQGVITINVVEADDVAREEERLAANEQYRTVLGHLRHESGHYYFEKLSPVHVAQFSNLFGDASLPYREALDQYYADGPTDHWRDHHISAYASAHPLEDWAETWGHYLHISDVLETAVSYAVIDQSILNADIGLRIEAWRSLSTVLNELNRSVGHGDVYPFILNDAVAAKLAFVDQVLSDFRADSPGSASR
ncbi:MAG: putative zinc-binding metallopeptidase [Pseudomonadota bacterium]